MQTITQQPHEQGQIAVLRSGDLLGDLFRDHFETSDESQLDPKRSGDARMENLHRCEIGQLVLLFQRKRLAEIVKRLNAIAKKHGLKTHSQTLEHLLDESDKK